MNFVTSDGGDESDAAALRGQPRGDPVFGCFKVVENGLIVFVHRAEGVLEEPLAGQPGIVFEAELHEHRHQPAIDEQQAARFVRAPGFHIHKLARELHGYLA